MSQNFLIDQIFKSSSYSDFKSHLSTFNCQHCPDLCNSRSNIVVDRGNPSAKIVFIGEAPGRHEDESGLAFVGRGGKLLDSVMASIGLDTNKDALIINVLKCRPPNNRPPTPEEAKACWPYLKWQLDFVKPHVVALFGATAAKYFLPEKEKTPMKDLVGKFFKNDLFPTIQFQLFYHPAYILRDPRKKPLMIEHAQALKKMIEGVVGEK